MSTKIISNFENIKKKIFKIAMSIFWIFWEFTKYKYLIFKKKIIEKYFKFENLWKKFKISMHKFWIFLKFN